MGNGVYGAFIEAFPELFTNIEFWKAVPNSGAAGYKIVGTPLFLDAIVVNKYSDDIVRRSFGGSANALDSTRDDIVYMDGFAEVEAGWFMRHPENGLIVRLVREINKSMGGFKAYEIEYIQGSNGDNEAPVEIVGGIF